MIYWSYNSKNDKVTRYQYQPWYVKLWRRKIQLLTWWYAFRLWRYAQGDLTFGEALDISRGMAHARMGWLYDYEDIKERQRTRLALDELTRESERLGLYDKE